MNTREDGYQANVDKWMQECFGNEVTMDRACRCHRFVEESIELAQACNLHKADVLMLVDYVYDRPVGEMPQEVGGVAVTLAALCTSFQQNMMDAAEAELNRVWQKIDKIRIKHQTKPKHSPLPE